MLPTDALSKLDSPYGTPAHARRLAVHRSVDDYFCALYCLLSNAEEAIWIAGWDIDKLLDLDRTGRVADGKWPTALGELLKELLHRKPKLHIYMLIWDWEIPFSLERRNAQKFKWGWFPHNRLRLKLDGYLPNSASHHQKVVVVDNAVACVGGMDITNSRWDTAAHRYDEPHRKTPDGKEYGPYHDVQAMVEGEAAQVLGEVFRERWQRVCGDEPPKPKRERTAWPEDVTPELEDIQVTVHLTDPYHPAEDRRFEHLPLFVNAIKQTEHRLYLQNQYLTSHHVAEALEGIMQREQAPEICYVGPLHNTGVFERYAMGLSRWEVIKRLSAIDDQKTHFLGPVVKGDGPDKETMVHAKTFTVDDSFCYIGSANLSNRSLWLDTEAGISIRANGDQRIEAFIRSHRQKLIGIHTQQDWQTVAEHEKTSLRDAIERSQEETHLLAPQPEITLPAEIDWQQTVSMADPVPPDSHEDYAPYIETLRPLKRNKGPLLSMIASLAVVVLLGVVWSLIPGLSELDFSALAGFAETIRSHPLGGVAIVALFAFFSLLMLPVTIAIALSSFIMGGLWGFFYSMCGCLIASALGYGVGAKLGRQRLEEYAPDVLRKVQSFMSENGIVSVTAIRFTPISHYQVINIACGALGIPLNQFLAGTFIGMSPLVLGFAFLGDTFRALITEPTMGSVAALVGVAASLTGLSWGLQWYLRRRKRNAE